MNRLSLKAIFALVILVALAIAKGAVPQAMKSDHWSPPDLLERAKHLQELAAAKGSASETLEKYPHHYTMLAFRNRSGAAKFTRILLTCFISSMAMRQ
jgi:hypothetical protein